FEQIQLARYFELLAQAQQTSLEAATASLDVSRYHKLMELAEQNLGQHQIGFQQIEQSVGAGVARAAALEHSTGRWSLAASTVMPEL
ncbi:flagellar motor protein MotB, partial [Pseudoalteromonas ruthenica]